MTMAGGHSDLFSATIAIDASATEISNQKLTVKLGTITDFYRHGIDYNQEIASLRFKVARNAQGKPVIQVSSDRKITGDNLKAVVKLTVGRKKAYGIYDIHLSPNKSGHRVAFNLLNPPHKSQPQQLAHSATQPMQRDTTMPVKSVSSENTAKEAALAKLRRKLMAFEQAPGQHKPSGQYRVSTGESISSIAMKLLQKYPEAGRWQNVMKRLVAINPDVFINGDINRLPVNAMLTLPGQHDFASRTDSQDKPVYQASKTSDYRYNTPAVKSQVGMVSQDQYQVSRGENISSIAFKLSRTALSGHSWRAVMKLLIKQNPDAFIRGDIDRIRTGSTLAVPQRADFAHLYDVAKGESVSSIAMKLHRQNPQPDGWRGLKSQLIRLNPEAFINGNPRWLREDAFLLLPDTTQRQVEAEMYEPPERLARLSPEPTVMAAMKPAQRAKSTAAKSTAKADFTKDTYQVTQGESLSAIALKLIPKYPQFDNWYDLMQALARLNPTLLANNDIGSIRTGTILRLPPRADNQQPARQRNTSSIRPANGTVATPYDKISKSLMARADKASSYPVPEGYTVSMVAIRLFPKYPEFDSWPDLMNAIYRLNPQAFINNDINQLRSNAELKLPDNNYL